MTNLPGGEAQPETLSQTLAAAQAAARAGDRTHAYALSLQVTEGEPENARAWLLCAENAPTVERAVACLNQANALQPSDPDAKQKTYRAVRNLLEHDPYLRYLDESDDLYQIRSGLQLSLIVPKDRAVPEAYPPGQPAALRKTYRWLWLAFLGLPFAGLGAIVFAPLAAAAAFSLYRDQPSQANRVHSLVIVLLSGFFWLVGLMLGVILLVHLA